MKKTFLLYLLLICVTFSFGQNAYTVGDETLELTTEVEGELDLLSTVTDGQYRYFLRTTDGTITELKNTKNNDNRFDEAYKTVLQNATSGSNLSVDKIKLTTFSLKRFIDSYNTSINPDYSATNTDTKVNFRLGLFGGITNHPFVENIGNSSYPQFAAELELYGDTDNPRHAGIFQVRQTLGSGGDYVSTELSLGYRLRILKRERFNLFVQNRFANLNFFSSDRPVVDIGDGVTSQNVSETQFDVPFVFGIGADIKISDNSYISIIYDSLFGLNVNDSGNFSTDILIGYKFKL